jgi:hypothetical protein
MERGYSFIELVDMQIVLGDCEGNARNEYGARVQSRFS